MVEKFTYFWGGTLSQWASCKFTVDNVQFNCAEQYMMWSKAMLFGDTDVAREILACGNPKMQKRLGRKVRGFNPGKWNEHKLQIVKRGNLAKFSQNRAMGQVLRRSAGTTLVEASPYDRIWGIGLRENDSRAKDRSQWQGLNLLGQVLTEVRLELFGE